MEVLKKMTEFLELLAVDAADADYIPVLHMAAPEAERNTKMNLVEVSKMVLAKLTAGTVSGTEVTYLQNATSNIQDQLDDDAAAIALNTAKVSSPWIPSVNDISFSSGNVGIGTDAVSNKVLNVLGVTQLTPNVTSSGLTFNSNGPNPRIFSSNTIQYQVNNISTQHFFKNDYGSNLTGTLMLVSGGGASVGAKIVDASTSTGSLFSVEVKSAGGKVNINYDLSMPNLPNTSVGLVAGDVWNNAGVLNIV